MQNMVSPLFTGGVLILYKIMPSAGALISWMIFPKSSVI